MYPIRSLLTRPHYLAARCRLLEDCELLQPADELQCSAMRLLPRRRPFEQMHDLVAPVHPRPGFLLAREQDGIIDIADDPAIRQMELGREVEFTDCRQPGFARPLAGRGIPPCRSSGPPPPRGAI